MTKSFSEYRLYAYWFTVHITRVVLIKYKYPAGICFAQAFLGRMQFLVKYLLVRFFHASMNHFHIHLQALFYSESGYSLSQYLLSGSFAVIEEHTNAVLPNCFDAIGLLLMIRLTNEHKVRACHA